MGWPAEHPLHASQSPINRLVVGRVLSLAPLDNVEYIYRGAIRRLLQKVEHSYLPQRGLEVLCHADECLSPYYSMGK